jgi:hypothetical protein
VNDRDFFFRSNVGVLEKRLRRGHVDLVRLRATDDYDFFEKKKKKKKSRDSW